MTPVLKIETADVARGFTSIPVIRIPGRSVHG